MHGKWVSYEKKDWKRGRELLHLIGEGEFHLVGGANSSTALCNSPELHVQLGKGEEHSFSS